MSSEYSEMGGWETFKSGEWFNIIIYKALKLYWEKADIDFFKKKYPKLNQDQIAKKIISLTAKNAAALGGATGAAMSTNEIIALITGGEGLVGLPANIAIGAATIGTEILSLAHLQLKMVADLAKLYDVPLDAEDPEDIWIIFAYAMGGSASELVGAAGKKIGKVAAKRGIKRFISKDVLKFLQKIGQKIGVKILQKTIIKYSVPVVSIGLGTTWNYVSTKTIGKIAQQHFSAWRELPDVAEEEDMEGPIIDHDPTPDSSGEAAIPESEESLVGDNT
jgi:hypothetical protein